MSDKFPIIVIGASRGGFEAIRDILLTLPEDFPALILIAVHIGDFNAHLPDMLAPHCKLEVAYATDEEIIAPGKVRIAPPNKHLMLDKDTLRLISGAKANYSRPAVDPMFRSAALSKGFDVIGVILSGDLDDGTVGLQAIKACGGTALVQDPAEAVAPGMPSSAFRYVDTDGCLALPDLVQRLVALVYQSADKPLVSTPGPTPTMILENKLSFDANLASIRDLDEIAPRSSLTCPECHGILWEMDHAPLRYRCHTGHTFGESTYLKNQDKFIEETLWAVIRALHEKQAMMDRHMSSSLEQKNGIAAAGYAILSVQAANQAKELIEVLKRMSGA